MSATTPTTVLPTEPVERANARGALAFVIQAVPTLLVIALVAGVGWWGHRNGWKLPKFSALNGATAAAEDWCATHSVPESVCVECDESLMPKGKSFGWCKEHGVPECVLCHPELAQSKKPITVTAELREQAKRALAFAARTAANPNCHTHERRVQFASAEAADKAGVAVEPVWTTPAVEFVAAPGQVGYDQTHVAHLSARSPGVVWRVFKRLGQPVRAGELLALIEAPEVGKAKAELLQAFAGLQLKEQTLASVRDSAGAVPASKMRESEAGLREAEIRFATACQALTNLGLPVGESELRSLPLAEMRSALQLLGVPTVIAQSIDPKTATSNLLPLVAPMDGVVASQDMVAGEVVDTSRILFELVDPRKLWLTFDVRTEEARRLKAGQPVRFQPDSGGDEVAGTLAWISTQADPKTRTVKVRADLEDRDGHLRANTFGAGRVILREEARAISVPNEAVQWDGCCHVVFVRDKDYLKADAPKVFHVRKVRVAAKDAKNAELVGVLQGELVATKGSGLLLTELLRGSLGEGCACHSKH
jgi:cobalt-zinc-cadmium efflux system membrane fusion protein